MTDDLISRQAAMDALWKALYEYEDKTEKQFQESEDLDVGDWILHRIFVQNMSDIDRQTILNLPSAEPVRHGKWVPKTIIIGGRDHVSGMKCSVCGEDPLNAEGDEFLTDYCPNCGAKMDEEKENNHD